MRSFALMTLLAASTTFAQSGPCKADREQFCPGLARGTELRTCMKSHADQLSAVCRQHIAEKMGRKGQPPAPPAAPVKP